MSEPKFTKGPWAAETEPHGVSIRGASGVQVAWCSTGMVSTPDGVDVVTHTHKRANAHLIAAAPELLAALKELRESVSIGSTEYGEELSRDVHPETAQKADRAIAKAEGRS